MLLGIVFSCWLILPVVTYLVERVRGVEVL